MEPRTMNDEEVRSRITVVVCLATALALALWAVSRSLVG
jgi:hypothetical protein